MASEPLREADLFHCKRCGDCCKGYGGTFVTPEDIRRIAAFLQEDPDRFVPKYCQMSGKKPVLAQAENGYCVFWEGLCRIHPVKPRMCRQWPFIPGLLKDLHNWHIMAKACPGIRTDISDAQLERAVKAIIFPHDRHL